MKLSVSAYRAHASAHKKILSSSYHSQLNYGSTGAAAATSSSPAVLYAADQGEAIIPAPFAKEMNISGCNSDTDVISPTSSSGQDQPASGAIRKGRSHKQHRDDDNNSNAHSSESRSPTQKKSVIGDGASDPDSDWNRSNQRWMKLRTTVQISSAIQKKPPLKREDSFLKRFSTRQIPETQETVEDTGSESASGDVEKKPVKRRRRYLQKRRSVVNPDENFYFYWLMLLTLCVLYNLWTLIVRQSFPELQKAVPTFWFICDIMTDIVFIFDIFVQLRTGYLEQGLMVYDDKKLACHYVHSRDFVLDMVSLIPLDLLQLKMGIQPLLRFTRFFKVYRSVKFYYIVESRTVWPNLWRVVNLIHILLILAHWFGCFYYLLSEAEGFQGDWVYPYRPGDYATLTRKYLGSLYWSTLTLTTIGDLPTPETNAEPNFSVDGPRSIPRRGIKSRLLQFASSYGYVFTIVSYLIGVFIFATIVGQVGNVITNRNANRLEFERLLDGAKTYMRHHKVPGGMKRRVLRWYDYSWSRGRIQGGGDINTALGLLPDKLKTELALHVNLSVLKKVTIFQECQPEFLHDLVLKMKAYIFTPGDSICRKGEVAREMFIIADGILEVISETGKVLTTMKAGDFFGEIGILNLDGLNKRTADVRSVGYSELFSLSREDVLAAMKDYPEAQEILQTLGRKRLMEVRCVNKKYKDRENAAAAAAAAAANAALHPGHVNQSDSSENSASKKIVEKFRSDVKGIRNVLKKTRPSRRSDESLEMQPLQNTSPKNGKSMLKRMSRVRSDEKDDKEAAEERDEFNDKTPSPIGAGLPLLQRLRLLKEKQESIQEEPEREINEGLPLIQRLQQLKIKNDAPTSTVTLSHETAKLVGPPCCSDSATTSTATDGTASGSAPAFMASKPTMKVSFKQRIQQMQGPTALPASAAANGSAVASGGVKTAKTGMMGPGAKEAAGKKEPPKTLSVGTGAGLQDIDENATAGGRQPKPIATISNKIMKPSIVTSSVISETDTDTDTPSIKPWSKLKFATVISSSYTSLTNCAGDDTDSATAKNYSLGNIPRMMSDDNGSAVAAAMVRTPSTHRRHRSDAQSGSSSSTLHPKIGAMAGSQTKFYDSVFDLSPEYNGLPFVKRLKILNERQKLVELETALQTRSFSLDSSKQHDCPPPISESLYRCYSDTSGIYSQYLSTAYETSSTASTTTSTSTAGSEQSRGRHPAPDYAPLSPESNETMERRKLKSILKKLTKSSQEQADAGVPEEGEARRRLMREPTLEGPPRPGSGKACQFDEAIAHETAKNGAPRAKAALGVTSPQTPLILTPQNSPQEPSAQSYGLAAASAETTTTTTAMHMTMATPTPTPTPAPTPIPTADTVEGLNINIYNSHSNINSNYSMFATNSNSGQAQEFDSQNSISNPKLEGFPEANEYFNQILCGVNHVITMHMNAMHTKFQSQFSSMACEVKRRDAIIRELQTQLINMEVKASSTGARRKTNSRTKMNKITDPTMSDENDDSSGSSAELLFMRGDSLDTVFTSSPPFQRDRESYSNSPSTSRGAPPDYNASMGPSSSHQSYSKLHSSPCGPGHERKSKALVFSEATGNLRTADSVILDIGESSSSSSSSQKLNVDDDDDEYQEDEEPAAARSGHHNDWEVRMLAAEMEKQERKRGFSLTENSSEHLKNSLLRRRRKFSDTETEYSDPDAELMAGARGLDPAAMAAIPTRPRASSLDQFNLRYGIGSRIFKAMSTDRDKDKL